MDAGLDRLNALGADEARERLRACCAATDWVEAVVAARPYVDRDGLLRFAADRLRGLDWPGVRQALDAHPRIGERVSTAGREAAWSAGEQSGVDTATAGTRAALVAANREYEERFGHVFLIFATGKTDHEMLAAARERLHHDLAVEQKTVRAELEKIVLLRISKLLDES
jgi:2-oxo-4-hydroxy-4-carboxy-5-ureidoimidazoline decarboxylase